MTNEEQQAVRDRYAEIGETLISSLLYCAKQLRSGQPGARALASEMILLNLRLCSAGDPHAIHVLRHVLPVIAKHPQDDYLAKNSQASAKTKELVESLGFTVSKAMQVTGPGPRGVYRLEDQAETPMIG